MTISSNSTPTALTASISSSTNGRYVGGLFSDLVAISKTVFAEETNFSSSQLLDGREFPIPSPIINFIDTRKLFLKLLKN